LLVPLTVIASMLSKRERKNETKVLSNKLPGRSVPGGRTQTGCVDQIFNWRLSVVAVPEEPYAWGDRLACAFKV